MAQEFVSSFRHSSPYINAHRGRTFVIVFAGEAVDSESFASLVHDIALLNSLGVRLVLVHGARPQIEKRLQESGTATRYVGDLRVTSAGALPRICEAVGSTRMKIEAGLSMGLANSPMAGARIRVAGGNFVTAKPVGIREGVDFGHTGEVRRIDTEAITVWLQNDALVLLSPIGYSPTGEIFNVSAEQIGVAVSVALGADKLLYLTESSSPRDEDGAVLRQLSLPDTEALVSEPNGLDQDSLRHLRQALKACRAGVRRVHLLERRLEGVLLQELYSRDGVGTLIAADTYEGIRPARVDDVGGILELIAPLEEQGILVRRSRERLETEIERFVVLERDGGIIGCSAFFPFPEAGTAELACVAVDPAYQRQGRAEAILHCIEQRARHLGLKSLFVLTTRATHWFLERGFEAADLSVLPLGRRDLYNYQRGSRVFLKALISPR